jgi:hypothetical protein
VRKVLTKLECLDGEHRGLATEAKMMFDRGVSAKRVGETLSKRYGIPVARSTAQGFRAKRWWPQRKSIEKQMEAAEAIYEVLGGNRGMDLLLFSKLFELLGTLKDPKQVVAVKDHVLKCRAQELKEQEFLFKSGQLKPDQSSDEEEEDSEEKTRKVVQEIRAVFGLGPKPERKVSDQQPPAAIQQQTEDQDQDPQAQTEGCPGRACPTTGSLDIFPRPLGGEGGPQGGG